MVCVLDRVDHLVFATRDVDATADELERRLGVRASPGGKHVGRGTRNALISLGPRSYLEIIGPAPDQPRSPAPLWFGIDALTAPRLVAWAANASDLDKVVDDGSRLGVELGPVMTGSRLRSDGVTLSWRSTDPARVPGNGLVPFFIDWGNSPHPAASAARGVELTAFEAEHPDPDRVRERLQALGLTLNVVFGRRPALLATIRTPKAAVQLR
jgi:hypothetical protein